MTTKQRVVLVSAGSRGIGLAAVEHFLSLGHAVSLCSRDADSVAMVVDRLSKANPDRVSGLAGDIGDGAFLERLVGETKRRFGRVDILVANNGGPPPGTTEEVSESQWSDAVARNLMSAVRLTRLVAPMMKENRWGRIIHLASTTGKEPDDGMALSNVTRAAVMAFAKTTSRELGPSGITVNTVLTGAVLTDRLRSLIRGDAKMSDAELNAAIAGAAAAFPVRYIPEPAEFARILGFLASEEASYLTGVALPLDGGYTRGIA
ncbi:MAG: SDR family oxidoreductase [Polyangiaceae bacterium]